MSQFLQWLAGNPVVTGALVVSLGVVVLMYVVAFLQGREISFWPPKIGARPEKLKSDQPATTLQPGQATGSNPIVGRGTVLTTASGDKVTLESDLYGGSNATLFRGRNSAGQQVIAKVFWRGLAPNSPPWELFKQEQRAAEILSHRNIASILDRGLFGGYPFTIMEYFGGGTLRDWLRTHERIPGEDILSIAGQLADAIDYAHSRGVVHRDIKPGNVLFESDPHGRVALGDFGIARILGAVQRDITAAELKLAGSATYLAPETVAGGQPTPASDVYSFGVVLYEMIAGRTPFDDFQETYATLLAKRDQDAPGIREYRAEIPDLLADRLAQTLSRDPAARPKSARAVLSGVESEIAAL
jgi:eukaryotic-like serine/threonine-protein kinase